MEMFLVISACLWEEGTEGLSQLIYLVFSSRSLCDSFWVGSSLAWKVASYAQLYFYISEGSKWENFHFFFSSSASSLYLWGESDRDRSKEQSSLFDSIGQNHLSFKNLFKLVSSTQYID